MVLIIVLYEIELDMLLGIMYILMFLVVMVLCYCLVFVLLW